MNNSKRSIIFFVSFMVVICLMSFVVPSLSFDIDSEAGEIIFTNILYLLFVFILPLTQMLVRLVYTSKQNIKENIFFAIPCAKTSLYNRLVYYILAIFIFLIPFISTRDISYLGKPEIISLLAWLIVIEVLLRITAKYTKLHFTKEGILIRGLDFSIDIPLGNDLMNHSGFYSYRQFYMYDIKDGIIRLYMTGDIGSVAGSISPEIIEPVSAYLGAKHITLNK